MTISPPSRGDGALNAYLDQIDAQLVGPRSWRTDVLAELRDGIEQAVDAQKESGLAHEQAIQAALADFGDPVVIANGFVREAAAVQARRIAGRLLATGPVVAGLWLATLSVTQPALLQGWVGQLRLMPLVGLVVAVAVSAALLASTAAGRHVLTFASRPRLATTAAATAAGMCALGDAVMLAGFGLWLAAAPPTGAVTSLVSALAMAVSATRLIAALIAVRHCAQVRALLA